MKNLINTSSGEDNNLSEEQRIFNKLVEQIEKKKKELVKWERVAEEHQQKHFQHLAPLECELYENRKKLILLFDTRLEDAKFTNGEKRKLKSCVRDMCLDMLQEKYDEEIEGVFEKYQTPAPKNNSTIDDLIEDIASEMKEKAGHWKEEGGDNEERYYEKREETKEDKGAKESMKEIYKKLVAKLHPDKETDEVEKNRKTEVMQRITQAYRESNLTELLKIELEETKEMIDRSNLSKKDVEGFNKTLERELGELREKVYLSKRYFQNIFRGLTLSGLSQKKINKLFEQELKHRKGMSLSAKNDLDEFSKNLKSLKRFIRSIEIRRHSEFDDFLFMLRK